MRVIDYGRLLLLAALWGASFLFMRITTPAFGALNSAFLRVLFAAIALGLLLGVQGKWSGYQGKFTSTLQLGVINSGLPFLMYCLAAQWLPAGYSATLNATAPMMGVLIGALCFAEPLTLRKGGGAILGAIGVAVIARPTSGLSAALLLPGIGACLTATACYGLAGFLTRRWIQQRGGLEAERVALGSRRRHAVSVSFLSLVLLAWACRRLAAESAVDSDSHAGRGLHGGRVYYLLPLDCRYRAAAFAVGDLFDPTFCGAVGLSLPRRDSGERIDSRRAAGLCSAMDDYRAVGAKTRGTGRRMMHRPADSLRETASRRRRLRAAPPGCLQ
ncbi:hypothetical protein BANRA_01717 [Klebsiella pneumoniae]|nr:hypothetical protein BANRA_01717 [Klebsiella pneumoniae]